MTVWATLPSNNIYEVSDDGRVRNALTMRQLSVKPHVYYGYLHVKLWRNGKIDGRQLHRIVCEAFHGPAPRGKPHVAHRDGVRSNNHLDNLRWVSRKENEADKILHNRSNGGERNGMSKISDRDAVKIRQALDDLPRSSGGSKLKKGAIDDIADQYGVTKGCIRNIMSGRRR